MPKAPINGIELYYESHGDGPAIVFAHGRGGNHLSWWQQVPHFSQDYRFRSPGVGPVCSGIRFASARQLHR